MAARREGRIAGFGAVGPRQVAYDLKFLIAVLTWGLGVPTGRPYLSRHPWSAERRKATGMRMPKESRPRRPSMSDEVREGLIRHSPHPQFRAALEFGVYTVSRNSSVRHTQWSDVDLENGSIRWRGEWDKNGQDVTVPLTVPAVEALRRLPRGVGATWVFPSAKDPTRPTSRHTFQTWLRRAKAGFLQSVEDPARRRRLSAEMVGLGFHGEKRAGVRDARFRALPAKIQETLARTNHETLRRIYDDVGMDEIAAAMRQEGLLANPGAEQRAAKSGQRRN
jgi:integrase